jgi:hypothetical protein
MVLLTASGAKGPSMDREDAFFHCLPINEKTRSRDLYLNVDDPLVQKALEVIWSQSDRPLSVADIARQLPSRGGRWIGVSPTRSGIPCWKRSIRAG